MKVEGSDKNNPPTQPKEEQKQCKVPMIRLKIKVPSKESSATNTAASVPKFYGTFKYRPFKLFPLLPPTSRYRVLIPPQHTRLASNPAIKLNYLWKGKQNGVYTDDSDLLCIALKEGWVGGEVADKSVADKSVEGKSMECKSVECKNVEGKSILVEVEVVDNKLSDNSDFREGHSMDTLITPRIYASEHHGHHIRITACSVNPSAVHLKRWRKRKNHPNSPLVTPTFKTNC